MYICIEDCGVIKAYEYFNIQYCIHQNNIGFDTRWRIYY